MATHSKTLKKLALLFKPITSLQILTLYLLGSHNVGLIMRKREVVKKEVLKLLHAGITYPVPYIEWVSHVQVVPKKGGMTVVKNEKNKLIPQRTITRWQMCIDY